MITSYKGNIAYVFAERLPIAPIVPVSYVNKQIERDGETHHITLVLKNEVPDVDSLIERIKSADGIHKILTIGTGTVKKSNEEAFYEIVFWPIGNKIRRDLNLPPKDFHVTVGFKHKDIHDVSKKLQTVIPSTIYQGFALNVNELYSQLTKFMDDDLRNDFLDVISMMYNVDYGNMTDDERASLSILKSKLLYQMKKYDACLADCMMAATYLPNDVNIKMRIAHLYNLLGQIYRAIEVYKEILSIDGIDPTLLKKANEGMELCYTKMIHTVDPRERHVVHMPNGDVVTLARNFSWVIPGKLASMSLPKRKNQIDALRFMGIGLVISVLEETRLDPQWFDAGIKNIHFDVKNYHPPSKCHLMLMMENIELAISEGKGVLVHCGGSKGRAGTVLACYIMKHGLNGAIRKNTSPVMSASEAIDTIRQMRPGSIETSYQEDFIKEYGNYLWENVKYECHT